MIFVPNENHDPRINLAIEQFLLQEMPIDEPILLFYINEPSIIIGRNQNTIEEINREYVDEHGIHVVRRLSGGGAVYHDFGNLNFSFIMPDDDDSFRDFAKVTKPIIQALHELGVAGAELKGRNDLVIDGMKFSGNAMYTKGPKTFSHGTLMLDVDLSVIPNALNVPEDKIKSKGIKSVSSRVTNLKPYLAPKYQNLTTPEFRDRLLKELFHVEDLDQIKDKEYHLTDDDKKGIDKIFDDYYNNWDWVYGNSPEFTVKKRQHFTNGTIDARLQVDDGKVSNVKFFGDYFGSKDTTDLVEKLKGVRFERKDFEDALKDVDLNDYFTGIPREEIFDMLF